MFVSRMTSSVVRDGEVALESLCAPVSWRVHVLLLLLTDHNRHVPITGPKSLGEVCGILGRLIVKQLRVTVTLLASLALPLSSS